MKDIRREEEEILNDLTVFKLKQTFEYHLHVTDVGLVTMLPCHMQTHYSHLPLLPTPLGSPVSVLSESL